MTAVGIIPARYASSRFPGKPLARILGKPMIQWVYQRAIGARRLDQVIVATDDQRIYDTVRQFGGLVEMTSPEAANGTERVAEVARKLDSHLIVNLQGDEPAIDPAMIDQLVELMLVNPAAAVGTLVRKIEQPADLLNPNIPKVVVDQDFYALYFSRSPIPFCRDELPGEKWLSQGDYYQHIGMYIYRRDFLLQLVTMPLSKLEQIEKLEQLRILENGYKIKVAVTQGRSFGVDVPDDIQKVEALLSGRMG